MEMSDNPQVNGAAPVETPAPAREMSEQEVMDGIEGLLDDKPRRRQPTPRPASVSPETQPEDAGQDPVAGPEDPVTGDEEVDSPPDDGEDGEEADEPQGIEPPKGWSREDQAVFQQLPPEAQAVIARREGERDKAFHAKTEEVAHTRRAVEATITELQSERQGYAQNLQQLLFVAAPEAQRFANLDWQRLAQEQPAEYVRLSAERDALRGRIGGIQQEIQRVQAQMGHDQMQQFQAVKQENWQRLVEASPDFADPVKGPQKSAEMRAWLGQKGFSEAEIGQVVDARVILVVEEAMRAARVGDARRQAEQKRTPQQAPSVQPPGAGRQRSDGQAGQRRQQKMAQLKKSGTQQDAISYLLEIL
jgi:hypothetical protein